MTGPWKAWKSKSSFPPLSTVPWKSRRRREIPTFPPHGFAPDGKVENPKPVSHFSTRGSQRRRPFPFSQTQNPRKEVGRAAASSSSLFRIILGLESAPNRRIRKADSEPAAQGRSGPPQDRNRRASRPRQARLRRF